MDGSLLSPRRGCLLVHWIMSFVVQWQIRCQRWQAQRLWASPDTLQYGHSFPAGPWALPSYNFPELIGGHHNHPKCRLLADIHTWNRVVGSFPYIPFPRVRRWPWVALGLASASGQGHWPKNGPPQAAESAQINIADVGTAHCKFNGEYIKNCFLQCPIADGKINK